MIETIPPGLKHPAALKCLRRAVVCSGRFATCTPARTGPPIPRPKLLSILLNFIKLYYILLHSITSNTLNRAACRLSPYRCLVATHRIHSPSGRSQLLSFYHCFGRRLQARPIQPLPAVVAHRETTALRPEPGLV